MHGSIYSPDFTENSFSLVNFIDRPRIVNTAHKSSKPLASGIFQTLAD